MLSVEGMVVWAATRDGQWRLNDIRIEQMPSNWVVAWKSEIKANDAKVKAEFALGKPITVIQITVGDLFTMTRLSPKKGD